jgi:hypothetical protein
VLWIQLKDEARAFPVAVAGEYYEVEHSPLVERGQYDYGFKIHDMRTFPSRVLSSDAYNANSECLKMMDEIAVRYKHSHFIDDVARAAFTL